MMVEVEMTRAEADREIDLRADLRADLWVERQQVLAYQGPHSEDCPDFREITDAYRVCDGYCQAPRSESTEEVPF